METKTCTGCQQEYSLDFFNQKKPGRLNAQCKTCTRGQIKKHYEANREVYKNKSRRQREKMNLLIKSLKDAPCADCKQRYPFYVMDFDHLFDKEHLISSLSKSGSPSKIKKEVAKCEVVCANCHRIRTHNRSKKQFDHKMGQ